jgi:hypothetical protein
LEGDGGITVSGNGNGRQPYIPKWSMFDLVAGDTSQAEVTITGSGTTGDPWVVSIETLGGSVVQTIYTANDTWVKTGGAVAHVVAIGGGGGGGAVGAYDRPSGGSGGSGGAMSVGWFALSDLPDTVEVNVGQGGSPGQPIDGQATGGFGGDSWFGDYLYAPGGRGGKSQAAATQTQYVTLGGTPPDGGSGGAGSVRDGTGVKAATPHYGSFAPTGGGNGEGTVVPMTSGGAMLQTSWGGQGGQGGLIGVYENGREGGLYGGGGGGAASPAPGPGRLPAGGPGGSGVVVVTVW